MKSGRTKSCCFTFTVISCSCVSSSPGGRMDPLRCCWQTDVSLNSQSVFAALSIILEKLTEILQIYPTNQNIQRTTDATKSLCFVFYWGEKEEINWSAHCAAAAESRWECWNVVFGKLLILPLFGDLMGTVQVHKIMFILKMPFSVRFDSTQQSFTGFISCPPEAAWIFLMFSFPFEYCVKDWCQSVQHRY